MTRANALGTSYALMENADIVEGKYRDATFDSKTSAYCAADADYSKQNPYDLDYDTPMNPGLPGRRISYRDSGSSRRHLYHRNL